MLNQAGDAVERKISNRKKITLLLWQLFGKDNVVLQLRSHPSVLEGAAEVK